MITTHFNDQGLESKIFFLDSIFLKRCFENEKDVSYLFIYSFILFTLVFDKEYTKFAKWILTEI